MFAFEFTLVQFLYFLRFHFHFHTQLLKNISMKSQCFSLFFDFMTKFGNRFIMMIDTLIDNLLFFCDLIQLCFHFLKHLVNYDEVGGESVAIERNAQ